MCGIKNILGQYLFAAFGMLEDMFATRQYGIKKKGLKSGILKMSRYMEALFLREYGTGGRCGTS